jgi:AraC-like DNA-binding protein
MSDSIHIDDVRVWHDVVCAYFLHGECSQLEPGFHVDLTLNRPSDVGFARLRSVRHVFEQTERHIRETDQHNFLVVLQLGGHASHVQDGREVLVSPGDLTCNDCSRPVQMSFHNNFERFVIMIPRDLILSALGPTERFTGVELGRGNAVSKILVPFLHQVDRAWGKVSSEIACELSKAATSLVITALAERFLVKVRDGSWHRHALLLRAEEYIHRHSRDPMIRPESVAQSLGIGVRHLQDLFQCDGRTASGYIWECRLQNTKQDLGNPCLASLSIKEIGQLSGFSDATHFSRRFKEVFGVTPSEFRENCGQWSGQTDGGLIV